MIPLKTDFTIAGTRAVVLLSGGLDSAVALSWAIQTYGLQRVHALSVDYGQRNIRELKSAISIAKFFKVSHRISALRLDLGGELVAGIPSDLSKRTQTSPAVVPARNAILLSMAAGYAATVNADVIVIGACKTDSVNFPDCTYPFLEQMESAISTGLKEKISICAPLLSLSKEEIVNFSKNVDRAWDAIKLSWSCYREGENPCGACSACMFRAEGFSLAKEQDPAEGVSFTVEA